jgi:hypothetical protein
MCFTMTTNVSEVEPPTAFEMTPCAATAFRICYKDIPGEIIFILFMQVFTKINVVLNLNIVVFL